MQDACDVFFSYHWRDHAAVERIARTLIDRGVGVFLDRWYLAPGQPWPQALEAALARCRAVAIFLGAEGLGPWQQREKDLALDRQGREPGFPVIPVLLARTDPGLGFLKLITWVDFSTEGQADIEVLIAAIRGERPGPEAGQRIESARATICPYRGLRPFREEDEPFFFGRAAFTETLTTTLARQSFVAVVGASGSGKSSVVRAGLIPRLRRGEGGRIWEAVSFVPTDRPLASLAASLLPLLEPDLSEVDRLAEVGKLARHLAEGEVRLRDVTSRILAKQPGTERLLLFADQWEELYTLCPDEAIRTAFVAQLLEVTRSAAVTVVLTLRGDFYGRALSDRALSDRLQDAVVNIGPMTRDELAETITRPADKTNLAFEAGLVETILDDVGDEPGSLPLLEFLLEALWKERRCAFLHYEAYQKLGRVAGAIAHRADEVFTCDLDDNQRQAAQRLLIRMVRPGEGVEDTRQRAAMPKADPVAEVTIRKLADARLVVTERDAASGRDTVEVAHEALIRGWQRLRGWVDQDREFLRTRSRIAAQARLWEDEGRPTDRLLPPGRSLAEGEDLLATRRADLDADLITYIETSAAAWRAEEEAKQATQHRRLRIARLVAAAMAVLALVAIGGGTIALWQREVAKRNAEVAQHNQGRALAALANFEAETGSPATALRVALAAVPQNTASDRAYARQAEGALWNALQNLRERRRIGHKFSLSSVAFSPDGRTLATDADDNTVRLWDVATGEQILAFRGHKSPVAFRGHEDRVLSAAFSPDGRTLATGSEDNTARLWDVATGEQIATLRGHESSVHSVAFSPDGRTLATSAGDDTALWDVATGKQIAALRGHESSVHSVAFSPDGRTLATGADDKTARLWDVATGKQIATFRGHVYSVAFSPDGRTLATSSWKETALWDVATGKQIAAFRGESAMYSVAFSPDGRTLATADDNTARLWDVATGKEIVALRGHESAVDFVAFSPDGRTLATSSWNNTALWDVATGKEIVALRGHEFPVDSVAFSPDGRTLATSSWDNTARLWDVATGKQITTISHGRKHSMCFLFAPEFSVAFSPDGRTLATSAGDNTARLWDVATGKEIVALRGHESALHSVAFSPDGRTLATGADDNTARLWDVATGKQIATLRGESAMYSVAFSPDGRMLATSAGDDTALWDVATGKEIAALRGHEFPVDSVAFSPDGRTLATSAGAGDNTARLWDVATGKEIVALHGHESAVCSVFVPKFSVAFSPDGRTLATGADDKTARLWDVATGKEIVALRGHSVHSVAFSPDGRTLATGADDKTARLWDVATGKEIVALHGHEFAVCSVAFSPDGRTLAASSWDNITPLWDVATGKQIATLRGESAMYSVAFSPDGRTLATGAGDNTARLWDVATGKQIATLRGESAMYSVAFSPDGRTLATGAGDNTARLWDVATGKQIVALRGHSVHSVAFSPDGRTLATGADDKTARLWDVATGKEIATFGGGGQFPTSGVHSVAFSPDGRTLATSTFDNITRLWDVATGEQIAALRGGGQSGVHPVAFSPDGRTLATSADDNTARLWPVAQGLIDYACARVHDLPLPEEDKRRFGIQNEWCTRKVSEDLRTKFGIHDRSANSSAAAPAR